MGRRGRDHVATHHTYDERAERLLASMRSAALDAPVRSMTRPERDHYLARLAEVTAMTTFANRALTSSPRSSSVIRLSARTYAKAAKREVLRWSDSLTTRRR
jgi:hypothetical protein